MKSFLLIPLEEILKWSKPLHFCDTGQRGEQWRLSIRFLRWFCYSYKSSMLVDMRNYRCTSGFNSLRLRSLFKELSSLSALKIIALTFDLVLHWTLCNEYSNRSSVPSWFFQWRIPLRSNLLEINSPMSLRHISILEI